MRRANTIGGRPSSASAEAGLRQGAMSGVGVTGMTAPRPTDPGRLGPVRSNSMTRPQTSGGQFEVSNASAADKPRDIGPVRRRAEEKLAHPERLNLDRRKLANCPVLENEDRLKLLNYQNNFISVITNLDTVPELVFLDLYNNCITHISGLECVANLRVLMLGKNRIRAISGLAACPRLDVLDLHNNQIEVIEGLDTLRDLRVLNLAGNKISVVDNMGSLVSLAELNLRRNCITEVRGISSIPGLQRLYLSSNGINSLTVIDDVLSCKALTELTLDGNAVTGEQGYRATVFTKLRSLRLLDTKRITEEDRRLSQAKARRDEARQAEKAKVDAETAQRDSALTAVKEHWTEQHAPTPPIPTAGGIELTDVHPVTQGGKSAPVTSRVGSEIAESQPTRHSGASPEVLQMRDKGSRRGSKVRDDDVSGKSYYVGIGSGRDGKQAPRPGNSVSSTLRKGVIDFSGPGALRFLGSKADCSGFQDTKVQMISSVSFEFVKVEDIRAYEPFVKQLTSVTQFCFMNNQITSLAQVASLGCFAASACHVKIRDNPVNEHGDLLKSMCIMVFPRMEFFNGAVVTDVEQKEAAAHFGVLPKLTQACGRSLAARHVGRAAAMNAARNQAMPLWPTVPDHLCGALSDAADHPQKKALERFTSGIIAHSVAVDAKIQALNHQWDDIMLDMVEQVWNKLNDYS